MSPSLASAIVQNIAMFAGDTPTITFGPVMSQAGTPVNLTGAVLTMTVWAGQNAYAPPLFTLTGITVPTQTGSATGTFSIMIPAAEIGRAHV